MSFSAMRIGWSIALAAVVAAGPGRTSDGAELPLDFFATHCQDCHGVAEANAELRLDEVDGWDLTSAADQQRLERVLQAIKEGAMPPETSGALSAETRNGAVDALHAVLMEVSAERPRRLRRLSRREYRQTIRDLFGFEFELPVGFPADSISHRFDNLAEGLTMSGPLMKGYFDAAIAIADRMVPPPGKPVEAKRTELAASDLVISYSSGAIIDGAMRLAARTDSMWRSCTWPEAFEVQTAGTYRISVSASRFAPRSQAWDEPLSPMQLQVRARSLNGKDGDAITKQRLLAEFAVSEAEPQRFQKVVELQPAETPVFHFANALLDGDRGDRKAFADLLRTMFANDPRLLAGWLQVEHGSGLRGGIGWDRVKALRDDPDLELDEVDRSDKAVNKLVKKMTGNPGLYAETVVYQLFEEGPALEIHDVQIEGPLAVLPTEKEKRQAALTRQFLGTPGKRSTEQYAGDFLERFLTKAFRRPVRPAEHQQYLDLLMGEVAQGRGLKAGAHLAIRTALMSPAFLYRGDQAGRLDEHGLATRLAYFLHGGPPDEPLREAARRGKLSQPDGLRSQAKRMLAAPSADRFASDFSRQWLETTRLHDIMPDARMFPQFAEKHRAAMIEETEQFFATVLRDNLPLETFIDPGFTFLNEPLAKTIYQLDELPVKGQRMVRVDLPEGSPFGGLLGQASVMMATANGVDTQPVVRGVWVLENVLGAPPPPPPAAVPALTPDTRGAQTVRELLAAHRSDASCARCHRRIDPLGYVLENFDPVGRWRTHYPVLSEDPLGKPRIQAGAKIDALGRYPGAEPFHDVRDLKRYVVEHLDQFGRCLAEKLLTYATGSELGYAAQQEIHRAVEANLAEGRGFQDLLLALIESDTFVSQ